MKKYLLTMGVIALFAVGFAASDEDGSSDSSNQTEESIEEKNYRNTKGRTLDAIYYAGQEDAQRTANDLLRQGYSRSDLESMATRDAEAKYITNAEKNLSIEKIKESEREAFKKQCVEAYVKGYMEALGK